MSKFLRYALLPAIVLVFFACGRIQAQIYDPVQRTSGHEQIRTMAADIVHRSNRVPSEAVRPTFYICNEGHLHWGLGWVGIEAYSLPITERMQIEWFHKYLTRDQQSFWQPYFREVDSLIDGYIRSSRGLDEDSSAELERSYYNAIRDVYVKGAEDYARANGVVAEEVDDGLKCCAAAQATIVLTTSARNIAAIKWIDAGTVWHTVATTGREPEYHTVSPGTQLQVSPGALYYYKLVSRSGYQTRRLMAPAIPLDSERLVLAWH